VRIKIKKIRFGAAEIKFILTRVLYRYHLKIPDGKFTVSPENVSLLFLNDHFAGRPS